jgi:plasmid stability protein
MAQLIVGALKLRVAKNRVSADAEHRAILGEVLLHRPSRSHKEALLAVPGLGEDADFAIDRGIKRIQERAPHSATRLRRWLSRLCSELDDRILPPTLPIAPT